MRRDRVHLDSPLALLPPGTAPAAAWTMPSVWRDWTGFSAGGILLGSAGSMIKLAGGTGGIPGT